MAGGDCPCRFTSEHFGSDAFGQGAAAFAPVIHRHLWGTIFFYNPASG